jgi:hypothetical protein
MGSTLPLTTFRESAGLLRLSPEGSFWWALIVAALLVALRYRVTWRLRIGPWMSRHTIPVAGRHR